MLLGTCGCGDSPARVVRDVQTTRNEFVDLLIKVTDEESAKEAMVKDGPVEKLAKTKWENIKKRLDEAQREVQSQERSLKRTMTRLEEIRTSQRQKLQVGAGGNILKVPENEMDTFNEYWSSIEAVRNNVPEIEATAKRLKNQLSRLNNIIDQLRARQLAQGNAAFDTTQRCPNLAALLKAPETFSTIRDTEKGTYVWGEPFKFKFKQLERQGDSIHVLAPSEP